MSSDTVLSHIFTLCELVASSHNYPSQIIEDRMRNLRTAIDDYFAAKEQEERASGGGDLGINVRDDFALGDFVG